MRKVSFRLEEIFKTIIIILITEVNRSHCACITW